MQDLETKAEEILASQDRTMTFIHSPFCATCHLAEKMLYTIEMTFQKTVFSKCNASLNPRLMENYQIESVPCLLVTSHGEIVDKVYAFHSVPYMYDRISQYVN